MIVENLVYLVQSSDGASFLTVNGEKCLKLPESKMELSHHFNNLEAQAARDCSKVTGINVDPRAIRLNTCGNDHIILCFAEAGSQLPGQDCQWVDANVIMDIAPELPENVRKFLERSAHSLGLPEPHYGLDVF